MGILEIEPRMDAMPEGKGLIMNTNFLEMEKGADGTAIQNTREH